MFIIEIKKEDDLFYATLSEEGPIPSCGKIFMDTRDQKDTCFYTAFDALEAVNQMTINRLEIMETIGEDYLNEKAFKQIKQLRGFVHDKD